MAGSETPKIKQPKSLSSYFDEYKDVSTYSKSRARGGPIFVKKDIYDINHNLAQLFRYIFVMHDITWQEFEDKVLRYANTLYFLQKEISVLKGNFKREVQKPRISFNKFEHFLSNVLGLSIRDISVTLQDRETGMIYTHSLSDVENARGLTDVDPNGTYPAITGPSVYDVEPKRPVPVRSNKLDDKIKGKSKK